MSDPTESTDLVARAEALARQAHAGQTRPNRRRQPVSEHLAEVAAMVAAEGGSPTQVAAAWLHDVVEDTPVTLAQVEAGFGGEVARLVDWLTDPTDWAGLPLAERKALQAARLAQAPEAVRLVKLADQLSNLGCVLDDPPLDLDPATRLAYARGALAVARACRPQAALAERLAAQAARVEALAGTLEERPATDSGRALSG